ncbi:hypothetical protein [Prescottella agglutinans]|uniref:hypothetical protein n=1 Tax=Prescottella agglutinans TaxID=1644129 RepID=UPI0024753F1E|nr:hypothetical protein [Prescottella agglutinans]
MALPLIATAAAACGSDTDGTAATQPQPSPSTVRATTATASHEEKLNRMVSQFDQAGLPHQGPQWLQERANEVCADWEKMNSNGFQYAVLTQSMNFRPVDFAKAGLAVTYLTQYKCPQWIKYIK